MESWFQFSSYEAQISSDEAQISSDEAHFSLTFLSVALLVLFRTNNKDEIASDRAKYDLSPSKTEKMLGTVLSETVIECCDKSHEMQFNP